MREERLVVFYTDSQVMIARNHRGAVIRIVPFIKTPGQSRELSSPLPLFPLPLPLSFTDFGAGAPRAERTQLVPGDSVLFSHSARACGHPALCAV